MTPDSDIDQAPSDPEWMGGLLGPYTQPANPKIGHTYTPVTKEESGLEGSVSFPKEADGVQAKEQPGEGEPTTDKPWQTKWNRMTDSGQPQPQDKPLQYPNVELGGGPPQDIPRWQQPYEGRVRPGTRLDAFNRQIYNKFGEERQIRAKEAQDKQRVQQEIDQRSQMEQQHQAEMKPLRDALLGAMRQEQQDAQQGQEAMRQDTGSLEQQLEDARTQHNRGVLNGSWQAIFKPLLLIPMALAFAFAGRRGFRHSYGALYFLSGFTGALAAGDKHQAKKSFDGYKEAAANLMRSHKEKQEDLKATLQNDKLNIEEKKLEIQLKLAEWGDKKGAEQFQQGGWEALDKISAKADSDVQKLQDSIDKAETLKDNMMYKEENKLANDYSKEADKSIKAGEQHLTKALALDKKIQEAKNPADREKLQAEQRYWYERRKQEEKKTQASIEAMTLARKHGSGRTKEQIDKEAGVEPDFKPHNNSSDWEKRNLDAAKDALAHGRMGMQEIMAKLQGAGIDPALLFQNTGTAEAPQ